MRTDDVVAGTEPDRAAARPSVPWWAFSVVVTAIDIGVAIAAFDVARAAGASEAIAYLVGGIGPVAGAVTVWVRARALSGASVAILCFALLSSLVAVIGGRDPRVLLYKDAVVTGVTASIFAGSLALPRPLAFYFGQRFATDGTSRGVRAWNSMWQYGLFRRAQYVVTALWAVTFALEATVKALVIHSTGFSAAYAADQVLPLVAIALGAIGTVAIAKHYWRVADRQPD